MFRASLFALVGGLLILTGGSVGQDAKKDDPKKDDPAKAKGYLPQKWGQLGLSDEQKQKIYKIQGKYNGEIEALEAKIKELKTTRDKEMRGVLTPDQNKRLDNILLGKE